VRPRYDTRHDMMIIARRDIYRSKVSFPLERYDMLYDKRHSTQKGSSFGSVVIMSSSSEDVVAYMYLRRRRQKNNGCWVHPYNVRNTKHSSAVVSRELSQHEEKFN
jgi:hypothetical protein